MATEISKTFLVGDTVWVRYPYTADHNGVIAGWTAVSRVVSDINFIAAANECIVSFTNGNPVQDGAIVRVYLTEAACTTAIVDNIISVTAALVEADTTTSAASTGGLNAVSLRRASS